MVSAAFLAMALQRNSGMFFFHLYISSEMSEFMTQMMPKSSSALSRYVWNTCVNFLLRGARGYEQNLSSI